MMKDGMEKRRHEEELSGRCFQSGTPRGGGPVFSGGG
jgi:hypothetical protein